MTTKTATYTPGPWHRAGCEKHHHSGYTVRDDTGALVADAAGGDQQPPQVSRANAALVAAAPDLLKALDSLLGSFGWMFDAMENTHCKCDVSDTECRDWDGDGDGRDSTDHEEIRDAHALLKVIRKTIRQARGETCA